jgi:hypothetical protein
VLPSLNLVADPGDRQYLRFGLAKTMARGRMLQLNNLSNSPDATVQASTLANGVPLTRSLEYDTWGRTVLFGINCKLWMMGQDRDVFAPRAFTCDGVDTGI